MKNVEGDTRDIEYYLSVPEMNKQLSVPNRMKLVEVVEWCMKKGMPNAANYFMGLLAKPESDAIRSAAGVWYINTEHIIVHFFVCDNDKAWKQMECDVTTYMGLTA